MFIVAAYHTLRECQLNKETLGEKISQTKLKIGDKRKHLEELRGELKILGEIILYFDDKFRTANLPRSVNEWL